MKHKYTNKYTPDHLTDWIIHCDICGKPTWYSEAVLLQANTGKGGLLVCSNDADATDYGLVPYKIPPESPVTTTRIDSTIYTQTPETVYGPFDYTYDPMAFSPQDAVAANGTWSDQLVYPWNSMTLVTWDNIL